MPLILIQRHASILVEMEKKPMPRATLLPSLQLFFCLVKQEASYTCSRKSVSQSGEWVDGKAGHGHGYEYGHGLGVRMRGEHKVLGLHENSLTQPAWHVHTYTRGEAKVTGPIGLRWQSFFDLKRSKSVSSRVTELATLNGTFWSKLVQQRIVSNTIPILNRYYTCYSTIVLQAIPVLPRN